MTANMRKTATVLNLLKCALKILMFNNAYLNYYNFLLSQRYRALSIVVNLNCNCSKLIFIFNFEILIELTE